MDKLQKRGIMYDLLVSYNCGISYGLDSSSENLDELRPRMAELDNDLLRWYVEQNGEMITETLCNIHNSILTFIKAVRGE